MWVGENQRLRIGQRETFNNKAVAKESSGTPMGERDTESELVLQSHLEVKKNGPTLITLMKRYLGRRHNLEKDSSLEQTEENT